MATIDLQPTLQNDSVIIRPLKEEDFDALYDAAKDPLIWEQHTDDRYKKEIFKTFFRDSMESGGALAIVDRETNGIIGSSRYKPVDGIESAVEIGWTFLARKYWGGEINKAVKTLMIDHAFKYFDDVILYIDKDNIRSQKAAEKIGAIRQPDDSPFCTIRRDERDLTYRVNRNDWQNPLG